MAGKKAVPGKKAAPKPQRISPKAKPDLTYDSLRTPSRGASWAMYDQVGNKRGSRRGGYESVQNERVQSGRKTYEVDVPGSYMNKTSDALAKTRVKKTPKPKPAPKKK